MLDILLEEGKSPNPINLGIAVIGLPGQKIDYTLRLIIKNAPIIWSVFTFELVTKN